MSVIAGGMSIVAPFCPIIFLLGHRHSVPSLGGFNNALDMPSVLFGAVSVTSVSGRLLPHVKLLVIVTIALG
jgi:hypothetical protein